MTVNKYQMELDEFTRCFQEYQNKKIVLYGIGRYTATLIEGLQDFCFVGLMDKDANNIGKSIFGLPIISLAHAETIADLIVINTSETYWEVVYNRISNAKIPVFFKNGERASQKQDTAIQYPYGQLSMEELNKEIVDAELVSFDFFDTLFMRSVCNSEDVFRLLERKIHRKDDLCQENFIELRNQAKKQLRDNYSLKELYTQIEILSQATHAQIEEIMHEELELEKRLLVVRDEMLSCVQYALALEKTVYIISDMYLPVEFYQEVLQEYKADIPKEHILVSNELNVNKRDGSMWKYYTENVAKGRNALHIGDNLESDVRKPEKYGIRTYHSPGMWDMATHSHLKHVLGEAKTDYDTAIMGCMLTKLFHNPYRLREDGKIIIKNNQEMGYCVFGPVILTFLLWLLQESKKDKIEKLVFMSRDGYFLKEDFEYLCGLLNENRDCCYLGISRQLAMTASISSKEELLEYLRMPYSGSIVELMEDRLDLNISSEVSSIEECVEIYYSEIMEKIHNTRKNYRQYLEQMQLDDSCAIVDLGYYGNNQKYLNKLLKRKLSGYYFNANLSPQNINAKSQEMRACFQEDEDLTGNNSQVLKKSIYLESLLTAPYGMIKSIDENGNFVCAEKRKNQEHISDKIEINQGVKDFISDFVKRFGKSRIDIHQSYVCQYYGHCFDGMFFFKKDVKQSFFNDNAMMNRIESMLFY